MRPPRQPNGVGQLDSYSSLMSRSGRMAHLASNSYCSSISWLAPMIVSLLLFQIQFPPLRLIWRLNWRECLFVWPNELCVFVMRLLVVHRPISATLLASWPANEISPAARAPNGTAQVQVATCSAPAKPAERRGDQRGSWRENLSLKPPSSNLSLSEIETATLHFPGEEKTNTTNKQETTTTPKRFIIIISNHLRVELRAWSLCVFASSRLPLDPP